VAQSIRGNVEGRETAPDAKHCLILGAVSLAMCGPVCGPLAIFYWFRAKEQLRMGQYSDGSRTMATAGLVMGIVAILWSTAVIVTLILKG
jgi:hypothetical protein